MDEPTSPAPQAESPVNTEAPAPATVATGSESQVELGTAVHQPDAIDELAALLGVTRNEVAPENVLAFVKAFNAPVSRPVVTAGAAPGEAVNMGLVGRLEAKLKVAYDHIERAGQNGHNPSREFISGLKR